MKHIKNIEIVKKASAVDLSTDNALLKGMRKATQMGTTENGAVTYTSSDSALLDFYAQAGAMRKNPDQALDLFKKAFSEDRLIAVRILFYLRDVRGGQGERDLFRKCLEWLGTDFPEVFEKIVNHVPEFGRWDDLFFDNDAAIMVVAKQLGQDKESKTPSLLAKWLPTVNASSEKTRAKAKWFMGQLGYAKKEIEYRKMVRDIRKKIKTVEEKMSARKWDEIEYSTVPSQASRIYKDAFKKHDEVRYGKFIEKAVKGEVKINAATLYPYQIYKSVESNYSTALEALWNQLPDYTQGKNALVVADVSGSMNGDPISVSVSLALYFAERNKGKFQDWFVTFSQEPKLQKIQGKTLLEKFNSIERSQWDMNTDLQAVFDLILNVAMRDGVPASDMPETLYIISDMEFDQACTHRTNFEMIAKKYLAARYKLPTIVFWNVDARSGKNVPVQKNQDGVALVSGFSPVIFKIAVENKNPEQIMLETVNSERYSVITL